MGEVLDSLTEAGESKPLITYGTVQSRIDRLYDTKWFQPNACYPVIFTYTSKTTSDNDPTVDGFLRIHTNNSEIKDIGKAKGFDPAPSSLGDYIEAEQKLAAQGVAASEDVLAQFSKISGLKSPNLPFAKNNGALQASTLTDKDATVNLEFLADRDLKVLSYLQAWQSKWFVYTKDVKTFRDKSDDSPPEHSGGEGFLGIANCVIDLNGNVRVVSHTTLFGLIPKQIQFAEAIGPQVSSNSIETIKVTCTYSHAVLVYEVAGDSSGNSRKLRYYYYQ